MPVGPPVPSTAAQPRPPAPELTKLARGIARAAASRRGVAARISAAIAGASDEDFSAALVSLGSGELRAWNSRLKPGSRGAMDLAQLVLPRLTAADLGTVLADLPRLEPIPRRGLSDYVLPSRVHPSRSPGVIRQGLLGDCWLIAVLAAAAARNPRFPEGIVHALPNGCYSVQLHRPVMATRWVSVPGTFRAIEVVVSPALPAHSRVGTPRREPSIAAVIEKAAAVAFGGGRYERLGFNFAGNAIALLTGRAAPARLLLPRFSQVSKWLSESRPVVASTLRRPGGSYFIGSETPGVRYAIMDGHVYAAVSLTRCTVHGRPDPNGARRLHMHNPVGGPEPAGGLRRTDLYLTEGEFRRIFLSVNAGPPLTGPGAPLSPAAAA